MFDDIGVQISLILKQYVKIFSAMEVSKDILDSQPVVLVGPMALRYGTLGPNISSSSSVVE